MRIRDAMIEQGPLLSGIVEMDESYMGGQPRKGNKRDDDTEGGNKSKRGCGTDKNPLNCTVAGGGRSVAKVKSKDELKFQDLRSMGKEHVDFNNCRLVTDEYRRYIPFRKIISHETINHEVPSAIGDVHTNTIEDFWAILKRGIIGQYHKVSIKYLNCYIDELCLRYSRSNNYGDFNLMIASAARI